MSVYTTEITSDSIPSDNPVHQRLLKGYFAVKPYIKGDLLELGCGEGRGIEEIGVLANSYSAVDKIDEVVQKLATKYPKHRFEQGTFPPIPFPDNSFDTIVSLHVIEHIKDHDLFVKEIYRVLRPGGKALITSPNIKMSLTRNPWHIREYTSENLIALCKKYFSKVEMKGIAGNEKVMKYYKQNKKSVQKITRFDILNLQYRLPATLLRIPYDLLNRMNRNTLKNESDDLVASIHHEDYLVEDDQPTNLDLFCILEK
ncbi:MAG: class I SAM-dependent methyltransferase [Cyclobacteriaceae bacterium]|nr:class I SAM-dependent methyltransferase [Cyclobacteriaceae bacterium HetDA_MAG_MS6]